MYIYCQSFRMIIEEPKNQQTQATHGYKPFGLKVATAALGLRMDAAAAPVLNVLPDASTVAFFFSAFGWLAVWAHVGPDTLPLRVRERHQPQRRCARPPLAPARPVRARTARVPAAVVRVPRV